MPPSVGMRFGKYELLSRIGAGGMGEVWRARDQDLLRDVAVKFLPEKYAADPNRFSRFTQEALAASRLNHPNIITIHDNGQTSGLHYIVMELVEGETLREVLLAQGERSLSVRRLLDIGAQIADGLAKAHAAGIVHRDLKPENVMVTSDGFVKILDFGLVKLRSDSAEGGQAHWFDSAAPTLPESPSPQTAVGAVLGTAGYMSPEQARGRPVDYRSDQFTLGAILYEMAAGQQAFHRETPAQTIAAIIDDPPEPLAALCPSLPPPTRWVIERCLAKDPAERYASTLDLARELRGLREHLGEVPSHASSPAATATSRRRRRRIALLALLAAVLAAFATWLGPPAIERATVRLGLRPVPSQKHIAVLPFRVPGTSPDDKALAEGVAELLTVRLAQLERFQSSLWVEPSGSVLQAGVTTAERAGRALGVTLVVTGSVQRLEGRLVLTATLEDARSTRALRAVTAADPDALVEAVVRMLELELGGQAASALRASASGVAEAATLATQALGYTPYAEGRSALERYEQSRSLERAISLFNRALEQDPRYAIAHAGLGEAYWRLYLNEKKADLVPLAERHCERALALDGLLARPWIALGMIHAGTGRAEQALLDFQKALDRDPRNPEAYRERGAALERLERYAEAEASYGKAIELRPDLWSSWNYLGAFYMDRNRFADAEAAFRKALDRAPDNARALSNLGAAVYYQERTGDAEEIWNRALKLPYPGAARNLAALQFSDRRYAEAARTLETAVSSGSRDYTLWRSLAAARYWALGERPRAAEAYRRAAELAEQERRVDPTNARLIAHLADCSAMLGETDKARELAAEAARLAPDSRRVAETLSGVYEQIGDRDGALRWLTSAVRAGYPLADVESDPTFEKLRQDPRYAKVAAAAAGRH